MAKNGDIGIKVNAEGTAEFSRKMKEAADSIKVLDSEQKLAEAQFKATGDAQQYAADMARILKEKMTEQQKSVEAAQAAVDSLTKKGVAPNSRSMQSWTTKLNTAKARLVDMQTELNNSQTELNEEGIAVDGVAESFSGLGETAQSIDKKITLEQAIQAVDWLKEKIETVIRTAARAAKYVWDMEAEGGKWADELNTAAAKAGLDVETYQSWQYASRFIDTSVDQIVAARSKLAKELGSTSEETAKAFNEIRVATRNVDGSVRDSTDVLFDTIDALARYTDQTEREIHAQKVLGESWKDLNPLIEAGAAAYKAMAQEGMENAVVSAENVQKLQGVDDANQRLVATLEKTKFTLLASLAEPFTKASEAIDGALTKFNEFLETEEGKAALKEVSDSLTGIIKSVTEKDFSGVVNTAKDAVKKFTGALGWIKDHGSEVVTAIEGLFAAWGTLKLTGDVLRFIQGVEAFKGLLGKGGAKAAESAAGAASAAAGGGFWSTLGATVAKAIPAAVGAYVALRPAETDEQQDSYYYQGKRTEAGKALGLPELEAEYWALSAAERQAFENAHLWDPSKGASKESANVGGIDGIMEDAAAKVGEIIKSHETQQALKDAMGVPLEELEAAEKKTYDEVQEDVRARWEAFAQGFDQAAAESKANPALAHMQDTGKQIYENIAAAVAEGMDAAEYTKQEYGSAALGELFKSRAAQTAQTADLVSLMGGKKAADEQWQMLYDALEAMLEEMQQEATQGGAQTVENFSDAITNNAQDAVDAAGGMAEDATQEVEQEMSFLEVIGENAAVGLANGINARAQDAINAASALAQAVAATMKSALQIASPSKVMARLGGFVAQGFAQGMEDQISAVERATNRMVETTTRAPVPARPAAAPGREGGGDINAYIVMDKEVVGQLVAPAVDGYIGAQIVTRR